MTSSTIDGGVKGKGIFWACAFGLLGSQIALTFSESNATALLGVIHIASCLILLTIAVRRNAYPFDVIKSKLETNQSIFSSQLEVIFADLKHPSGFERQFITCVIIVITLHDLSFIYYTEDIAWISANRSFVALAVFLLLAAWLGYARIGHGNSLKAIFAAFVFVSLAHVIGTLTILH